MEATAYVNGVKVAESRRYIKLEGNVYFPPDSIVPRFFSRSETRSVCPWKGVASYGNINVGDGNPLTDAAWSYTDPKKDASHIKSYVAFDTSMVHVDLP
ncbi:hypothetical protein H072_4073 [Dactylellina haptotyla CBS 200.50]|uniref:DUF427 domain-containing protein n=1 Tax=Dactylellina haptotyla (strain CBS 200.50) TaxID=1284197 RepID=S8AGL0_DACHA|nr:hypothetical protein H072_4073 [Dactylellina haptotyla CBS 200.50]